MKPCLTCSFEEPEGTYYVCFDERTRTGNAAVNVGFCCKMDNCVYELFAKNRVNKFAVTDISADELVALVLLDVRQIVKISCVCQLVDVDDPVTGILMQHIPYKV
jgi:hypothetical protein